MRKNVWIFLVVIGILVACTPTMIRTFDLRPGNDEVIVPRGYKMIAVGVSGSTRVFYCQRESVDINLVVECGPGETIGDRYILPEGFTVVGVVTNEADKEETEFFCQNLRTSQVSICKPVDQATKK